MFIYFKAILKVLTLACLCMVLVWFASFTMGAIVGFVDAIYSYIVDVPLLVWTEDSFQVITISLVAYAISFFALIQGVKRIIATTSKELATEA